MFLLLLDLQSEIQIKECYPGIPLFLYLQVTQKEKEKKKQRNISPNPFRVGL